jgi:hypothetical protein
MPISNTQPPIWDLYAVSASIITYCTSDWPVITKIECCIGGDSGWFAPSEQTGHSSGVLHQYRDPYLYPALYPGVYLCPDSV